LDKALLQNAALKQSIAALNEQLAHTQEASKNDKVELTMSEHVRLVHANFIAHLTRCAMKLTLHNQSRAWRKRTADTYLVEQFHYVPKNRESDNKRSFPLGGRLHSLHKAGHVPSSTVRGSLQTNYLSP
jgi:hypothetical protein